MNYVQSVKLFTVITLSLLLMSCGGGAAKNQGPTVSNSSPSTINEREQATLSVQASDPDGTIREIRWLQTSGPSISFTNGSAQITFTVPEVSEDTGLSFSVDVVDDFGAISSTTVSVTIININRAPVANSENLNVAINDSVLFNLSASDPDDDQLTYSITQQPSAGTLTLEDESTQQYRYTPDTDSTVADSIEFSVSDGDLSDTATISFTVLTQKAAPLKITAISAPQTLFDPHWFEITNISSRSVNLAEFKLNSDGFDADYRPNVAYQAHLQSVKLESHASIRVFLDVLGVPYFQTAGIGTLATAENDVIHPNWHANGFIELVDTKQRTVDLIRYGNNQKQSSFGYRYTPSQITNDPTAAVWQLSINNDNYLWVSRQ